jgi:hypothetical protein
MKGLWFLMSHIESINSLACGEKKSPDSGSEVWIRSYSGRVIGEVTWTRRIRESIRSNMRFCTSISIALHATGTGCSMASMLSRSPVMQEVGGVPMLRRICSCSQSTKALIAGFCVRSSLKVMKLGMPSREPKAVEASDV